MPMKKLEENITFMIDNVTLRHINISIHIKVYIQTHKKINKNNPFIIKVY